jgi:hypothetical protein
VKPLPPAHIYCEQRDECDLPERYFCTFHEVTVPKQETEDLALEPWINGTKGDAR